MGYTVQEKLGINWLENVSGCTVADAIEYLKTLDKNYILSVWLEGDTHGADIECDVLRKREETKAEKWERLREPLLRNLETCISGMKYNKQKAKEYGEKHGGMYYLKYLRSAENADKYADLLIEHDKIKP